MVKRSQHTTAILGQRFVLIFLAIQACARHWGRVLNLACLGISLWEDGHWQILTWQLAPGEDAASWGAFLGTLHTKDITEETTQLEIKGV